MTQEERQREKEKERLGIASPYVEVREERALAYVHPITGESNLPVPPFVEDGNPPPSKMPWGISDEPEEG